MHSLNLTPRSLRAVQALACSALLSLAAPLHAQLAYHFTVNTSPLVSSVAGPFYLDFQLVDGSGVGDGNNKATLSNFMFGGGAPLGAIGELGSAIGNLSSTVTLTDGSFFNEFYQRFTPGASLQFDLSLTTNVDAGLVPDEFSFAILDSTLANLPTLSAGSDVLASIDITSSRPIVKTFATDGTIAPAAGGAPIVLAAPSVTPVPEPSTFGLAGAALLATVALARRRRTS